MSKFKVGDIVVGNRLAHEEYWITCERSQLRVVKCGGIDGIFTGQVLYSPRDDCYKRRYTEFQLEEKFFDLEALEENE